MKTGVTWTRNWTANRRKKKISELAQSSFGRKKRVVWLQWWHDDKSWSFQCIPSAWATATWSKAGHHRPMRSPTSQANATSQASATSPASVGPSPCYITLARSYHAYESFQNKFIQRDNVCPSVTITVHNLWSCTSECNILISKWVLKSTHLKIQVSSYLINHCFHILITSQNQ